MSLFPYQKPHFGLSLGHHSMCLIERPQSWFRKNSLPSTGNDHSLPGGILKPSYKDVNIAERVQLIQEILQIRASSKPATIALTLPDLCGQIELFELETFPSHLEEQETFLKWRFQENSPNPLGEQSIVFQKLPSNNPNPGGEGSMLPLQRVLAASIRKDVLREYEEICERTGLIPIKVGLSTIEIFNYFQSSFRLEKECFFVCLGKESFSFFAFQFGTLSFLRIKPMIQDPRLVIPELIGTLQVFDASNPHQNFKKEPSLSPLYYLTDWELPWGTFLSPLSNTVDAKALHPLENNNWGVQAIPLIEAKFPRGFNSQKDIKISMMTLSAWAGLY